MIVRYFNRYGPRMGRGGDRLIPSLIDAVLRGERLPIDGDRQQTRSLTFVACAVDATMLAAKSAESVLYPMNVGDVDERAVIDIAQAVAKAVDVPFTIRTLRRRPQDPQPRRPDLTRAARLDWFPKTTVDAGLALPFRGTGPSNCGLHNRAGRRIEKRVLPHGAIVSVAAVPSRTQFSGIYWLGLRRDLRASSGFGKRLCVRTADGASMLASVLGVGWLRVDALRSFSAGGGRAAAPSHRGLSVKPCITHLWQVGGRSNLSLGEWMRLNNDHIVGWSPLNDLAIIARTVPAVICGDGAH